jgi:GNAT superfamily N-acetyltransferase
MPGSCLYAVVGKNRLEELSELRMEFIRELHPELSGPRLDEIAAGSRAYIEWLLADEAYVGFIGVLDSAIVCTAALLVYRLPPLASAEPRKVGHVLNFFTRKAHRGNGYGRGLMEYIQEYGRERGFHRLFLNATEDGYPLYRKCGFADAPKAMEYNF